jgi:hypothetical protein
MRGVIQPEQKSFVRTKVLTDGRWGISLSYAGGCAQFVRCHIASLWHASRTRLNHSPIFISCKASKFYYMYIVD